MPDPQELLKSMGVEGNLEPGKIMEDLQNNKFDPMKMVGNLFGGLNSNDDEEKELDEEQLKEMENFYNNLSTQDMEDLQNMDDEDKDNKSVGIGDIIGGLTGNGSGGGLGNLLGSLGSSLLNKK